MNRLILSTAALLVLTAGAASAEEAAVHVIDTDERG